MYSRIVLISDDSDFFEYITPKLMLRRSDELYRFSFDDLPEKLHLLQTALLIINSESKKDKTLELLHLIKDAPAIVFEFNENETFRIDIYKAGAFDYITLMTTDDELRAKVFSGLNIISSMEKNKLYREMLVKNNLITENNEVFLDYNNILDRELEKIKSNSKTAVLVAISPNDKSKFLIRPNQIETTILNNIRQNDILMNYAANKYFLFLYNTDSDSAKRIWEKIRNAIPEKMYAGFAATGLKGREQLVNEALNKLHEAISKDYSTGTAPEALEYTKSNFKMFRQEFNKKLEQIITPVFYHIEQKYNEKLFGMAIEHKSGDGFGILYIKSKHIIGSFSITSPGFSNINIDITYQSLSHIDGKKNKFPQAKRISVEPEELESGFLEDLLLQFINEFKKEANNEFN